MKDKSQQLKVCGSDHGIDEYYTKRTCVLCQLKKYKDFYESMQEIRNDEKDYDPEKAAK